MSIIFKKLTVTALLQVLCTCICFGDEEDNTKQYFVEPIEVICDYPFNDTTKWAVTCRVWGVLKYFHPNLTTDKLDWDQVLLERIGNINRAETPEQVNAELMQMIQLAGEYDVVIDPAWNDSLNMNVNLCWLDHSFVNDTIKQKLREIASLSVEHPSYYLKAIETYDIFYIPNEKEYDQDVLNQYEYRLLSLFRYWNVIYYLYPYKYLMYQSWDMTLSEFIPLTMSAIDIPSYHIIVRKLATRLNDGHISVSISPPFLLPQTQYITLIDTLTVISTSPIGSFLTRGDILISLDNKPISLIRDSIAALIPSSHQRYTDFVVNGLLYRTIMDGCLLTVMRNNQMVTLQENKKYSSAANNTGTLVDRISQDICYVNLDNLKESDFPDIIDNLNNYKGIIIDLRKYHRNAWMLLAHVRLWQNYCTNLTTMVDIYHLGSFFIQKSISNLSDKEWNEHKKYKGKIAVLISEGVSSTSETLAMGFRINGATLVGTTTAGTEGGMVYFSLPGGMNAYYPCYGFYYPDGTQIQRTGIIPDIEVYPTMEDIMEGRDEVLEAAIKYLNSK